MDHRMPTQRNQGVAMPSQHYLMFAKIPHPTLHPVVTQEAAACTYAVVHVYSMCSSSWSGALSTRVPSLALALSMSAQGWCVSSLVIVITSMWANGINDPLPTLYQPSLVLA
jgi:hypothetical protein